MRQDRVLARASERIGDGGALVVGEAVGGGGVSGVGGPIIVRTHEVDRRQDHQHRPQQREPAAGEEGAKAGRGEHGDERRCSGRRPMQRAHLFQLFMERGW